MNIRWDQSLEAMYGYKVDKLQVPIWEHYLREEKTGSEELTKAIEMAADEGMKPDGVYGRVTVRDLRKWLKVYRVRKKAGACGKESKAKIDAFVTEQRAKLARGGSEDDASVVVYALPYDICTQNDIIRRILG